MPSANHRRRQDGRPPRRILAEITTKLGKIKIVYTEGGPDPLPISAK
ncbi:hypothetical protein [Planotetraspora silvatica]|nr:hypothetical protein [Planotetraspora silvatica]